MYSKTFLVDLINFLSMVFLYSVVVKDGSDGYFRMNFFHLHIDT